MPTNEIIWTGGESNTRPECPTQTPLRVLLDWVQVTFTCDYDWEEVFELFGLGKLETEYNEWGTDTFKEHMRSSNIVLQRKDEFTYQLRLSGQGCREFETLSGFTWLQLFTVIRSFPYSRFTRLDLAIDDFEEHFTVNKVKDYLDTGYCITRLEESTDKVRKKIPKRIFDEETQQETFFQQTIENSLYIGSLKSRLSINIYDKKLEREEKDQISDGTWDSWTRTELRCKREYADQTADFILQFQNDLGQVALGILNKNIRFVQKNHSDNRVRRRPNVRWWDTYIGKVEKLKFSLKAPDRTIEKAKTWFNHSVSPTLAAIYQADPVAFNSWLLQMRKDGEERLNDKHKMMIQQAKDLDYQEKISSYKSDLENARLSKNEIMYKKLHKKRPATN